MAARVTIKDMMIAQAYAKDLVVAHIANGELTETDTAGIIHLQRLYADANLQWLCDTIRRTTKETKE